jgi:hypothetical protein
LLSASGMQEPLNTQPGRVNGTILSGIQENVIDTSAERASQEGSDHGDLIGQTYGEEAAIKDSGN